MAELVEDKNPVKDLYRRLLVDPNTLESARKYSFKQFEDKLLTDRKTQQTIGNYAVEAGIVKDIDSFNKQYILKEAPVLPQEPPKVSLAPPVQQSLMERTMGQAGIPLMPAQRVQKVPKSPVGVYAPEEQAPMPTTDEMTREQLVAPPAESVAPVGVLAPQVEEQPQNIGELTTEQITTPVTDAAEQEKLRDIENSQKTWAKKTADEVRTMTQGGIRIGKTMLSTLGNIARKIGGSGVIAPSTDDPLRQQQYESNVSDLNAFARQEANQDLYKQSQKINEDFEKVVKQTGIKTDIWEEIKKGNWDRVPEATIYTVATGAMQVLPALATLGTSTYLQTLPDAYANGVKARADLLGITPEEVIASGQDDEIIAQSSALIQAAFDKLGLNLLSKSIAGKGAFRAVKDWIVNATGNKAWSRALGAAGGVIAAAVPEFLTGGAQETVATTQEAISGEKPIIPAIQEALPGRITSSAVGEAVGGTGTTGIAGVYRAATSGYSPLSKAPVRGKATQRADFDVVLVADKLNNRKKLIQAMESAVKNNPEAEGQIRNQYNKQIDALKIDDAQVAETYGAMDTLPDSPAKQKADQVMAEYLTEKGVIGQPEAAAPPADTSVPTPPAPAETQPITVQVPEPPPSENAQLDADIEAGQERTGFVFSSPLASFSNQAKSILQSVREGKYIALDPAKQLLEELYDAYKIYGKQKESTARNLTMDQIDQGIADFEDALSSLGDYISRRDEGQFLQDFVGRKQQEEEQGVAQPEVSTEIAPDVTPTTEPVAPGPVSVELPSLQVQEGGENVTPVSPEAPQGEGQVGEQAVPIPAPVEQAPESPIAIRQFDAIKPTQRAKIKAFEDRNGPDAYKRMQKIKDDFENIMTKLSDKITQECP